MSTDATDPQPRPETFWDQTARREVTAKFLEGYGLAHEEYKYGATRAELTGVRGRPGVRVEPDDFWDGMTAAIDDQEAGRDRFFRGPLGHVTAGQVRVGDVLHLDGDPAQEVTVTSVDGDHKDLSIEFDHDESTISSYQFDEPVGTVRAQSRDVDPRATE